MGILTRRRGGAEKICGVWVVLLLLAGCGAERPQPVPLTLTPPPLILRVGVVDTAVPFTNLIAMPYAQETDRAILQIIPGNTDALFADLKGGQLDAILVHHIPESMAVWFNPVAVDGLVVIVHPDNPVTNLSRGEVQAVFNGRFANWSAVGGPDAPITLVSRERGSGTRAIFVGRVMGEQRISINARVAAGDTAVQELVAADPNAIGYSMMGAVDSVKVLELDGIPALTNTVTAQAYPLSAPLYFVSLAVPQGELRAWLAWLQAEEGQDVVGVRYGRVR